MSDFGDALRALARADSQALEAALLGGHRPNAGGRDAGSLVPEDTAPTPSDALRVLAGRDVADVPEPASDTPLADLTDEQLDAHRRIHAAQRETDAARPSRPLGSGYWRATSTPGST